ncbi:MAG: hypothetical protein ACWGPN_16560, partial [Gammaproteobacteria bacterium]
IGFGSPGAPVGINDVLKIHLGSEVEATTLGRRVRQAEHRLICSGFRDSVAGEGPVASPFDIRGNTETEQLRKRRHVVEAKCSHEKEAARRLARVAPEERQPVSSREFMVKIWGDEPYANVAPQEKVNRPRGDKLFEKLGLPPDVPAAEDYRNQIDFHLLGFRQLRDPQNFARADVQQVIRTKMSFDRLPWPVIREYYIEINDQSEFSRALGLKSQKVDATDVFEYRKAKATFGETSTIVT